jgi:ABC-type cobalamin transport system ATPase subunit
MAKIALYDELLCCVEDFLSRERCHGTFIVDGSHDSDGHLRSAHRALLLKHRRIVEDAGLRRSSDSQLLQMADGCARGLSECPEQGQPG